MILQTEQLNTESVKHLIYQTPCFLFKVLIKDRLYGEHIHLCKDTHHYLNINRNTSEVWF